MLSMSNPRLAIPLLAALGLAGCGDDSSAGAQPSVAQSSVYVRVAHLSPDAPAVDLCLKLGSGAFAGPVLRGLGATAGLAYPQVTRYLTLDAGAYTVRLVAPGAADCSTSLAGLPDYALPALAAGTYATAAAVGLVGGTPPFTVKPFVDDHAVASGKAAIRFVHASPGTPAVDVGVGSGAGFTPLFVNVAFPDAAGAGGGIDANGYLVTDPLAGAQISARVHGSATDALVVPGVSAAAGTTSTVFAIGLLGSGTTPLRALACVDNDAPSGLLATCAAAP